jgi:hypothetical protein
MRAIENKNMLADLTRMRVKKTNNKQKVKHVAGACGCKVYLL